jgi:hypothetical protein
MINRAFASLYIPAQRITRNRSCEFQAIVNARFDLCAFFVVVPGDELQRGQLPTGVVKGVDFRERPQPCLSALLPHDAV